MYIIVIEIVLQFKTLIAFRAYNCGLVWKISNNVLIFKFIFHLNLIFQDIKTLSSQIFCKN